MKKNRDELIKKGIIVVDIILNKMIYPLRLNNFMSPEDIEDMRQEGMLQMIEIIDNRYDPEKKVQIDTYLSRSLEGFFLNYTKKEYKRQKAESQQVDDYVELLNSSVLDTEFCFLFDKYPHVKILFDNLELDSKETHLLMEILEYINELPENLYNVVIEHYFFGKTIVQIEKEMNYSNNSGWVNKMKNEAINKLKQKIRR